MAGFVCLLEIHLTFAESASLKSKRKDLTSVRAQLQRRFGAAVAETDHHDLWQRSTLAAALVGRDSGRVLDSAAALERWLVARFPDGVRVERRVVSADEVLR